MRPRRVPISRAAARPDALEDPFAVLSPLSSKNIGDVGVFARYGRSDHTRRQRVAPAPGVPGVAVVDVLGRVDELADGTGGSVDAVTGAVIGPYRKSRVR
jgi:hypothetical protein